MGARGARERAPEPSVSSVGMAMWSASQRSAISGAASIARVIGARLERIAPSAAVRDFLADPVYVQRLGAPLRDLLRGLARTLREEEVAAFVNRTLERELRAVRVDATMGAWLARAVESEGGGATFAALATSLA